MDTAYMVGTLSGTGFIAVWLYVRFPARRPRGIMRALTHVVLSFVAMEIGKDAVLATVNAVARPYSIVLALVAITVPVLSYVFLSWMWLAARLFDLGRPPRGGHPVEAAEHHGS
jgi:hypothetical protein